jgi:hypothetical protein
VRALFKAMTAMRLVCIHVNGLAFKLKFADRFRPRIPESHAHDMLGYRAADQGERARNVSVRGGQTMEGEQSSQQKNSETGHISDYMLRDGRATGFRIQS